MGRRNTLMVVWIRARQYSVRYEQGNEEGLVVEKWKGCGRVRRDGIRRRTETDLAWVEIGKILAAALTLTMGRPLKQEQSQFCHWTRRLLDETKQQCVELFLAPCLVHLRVLLRLAPCRHDDGLKAKPQCFVDVHVPGSTPCRRWYAEYLYSDARIESPLLRGTNGAGCGKKTPNVACCRHSNQHLHEICILASLKQEALIVAPQLARERKLDSATLNVRLLGRKATPIL